MNSEALRRAYSSNDAVKGICNEMAERERNQSETKLARILARLQNNGSALGKHEVISGFRLLEEAGCGQYVEGRHGWKSRFVWAVGSLSASQIAQGANTAVEALPASNEDEEIEAEIDTLTHVFHLRTDFDVEIQLPSDLTPREAARIAAFVSVLPIEE
jgi:hypothetical protein